MCRIKECQTIVLQPLLKDSFAVPRIEEMFDCLHAVKYFPTIDMKAGYHQIEVEEEHKEL